MTSATPVISADTTPPETPPDLMARMTARLAELRTRRQAFLDQAQRELAAYDGAIAELTALLEPPSVTPVEPGTPGSRLPGDPEPAVNGQMPDVPPPASPA
jgi:hypothetical protein